MVLNQQLKIDILPLKDMNLQKGVYHARLTREQINPDVFDLLAQHQLKIAFAEIFTLKPYQMASNAHIDGSNIVIQQPWRSRCKLNWTYSNAEKSNRWYKITNDEALEALKQAQVSIIKRTEVNSPYLYIPFSICEEIFAASPHEWNLFDAGTPHAGFNDCPDWRWNISFTLVDLYSKEIGANAWLTLDEVQERMVSYV
jgi:hypothetical protein